MHDSPAPPPLLDADLDRDVVDGVLDHAFDAHPPRRALTLQSPAVESAVPSTSRCLCHWNPRTPSGGRRQSQAAHSRRLFHIVPRHLHDKAALDAVDDVARLARALADVARQLSRALDHDCHGDAILGAPHFALDRPSLDARAERLHWYLVPPGAAVDALAHVHDRVVRGHVAVAPLDHVLDLDLLLPVFGNPSGAYFGRLHMYNVLQGVVVDALAPVPDHLVLHQRLDADLDRDRDVVDGVRGCAFGAPRPRRAPT